MLGKTVPLVSLVSFSAFANAAGAIGYSGAPGTGSCNDCHAGGSAPTVTIAGPDSLAAGATGAYTVTVTGGSRVGVNIAITEALAALNPTSANLGIAFRELYQASPQASGTAFQFSLSAPPVAGPLTLYASGNATNGNSSTSGDRSANATKVVTIMPGSGMAEPVISTAAAAAMSPLRGKSTQVSVGAADDGGPANLTYIWTATGPGAVLFSPNSSNSAASSSATFSRAGSYMVTVTVRDSLNKSVTSSFPLTVEATYTALRMTPYAVKLAANATQTFTAVAVDQFEAAISSQPSITFEAPAGGGTFGTGCTSACTSNVFKAQASSGGPFVVVARSGGIATSSTVAVGTTNLPAASDTVAPTVTLVEPRSGLPLTDGMVFEAIAADPPPNPSGVAKVEFTISEITVAVATGAPWKVTYMAQAGLPSGKQPLVAVATDLAGNFAKSSSVVVDVPASNGGGAGGGRAGGAGGSAGAGGSGGSGGGGMDGGCACGASGGLGPVMLVILAGFGWSRRRRRSFESERPFEVAAIGRRL